jgi:hypothetical protein
MRPRMQRAGMAGLHILALFVAVTVANGAEPAARIRTFAAWPDWTGIWMTEAEAMLERRQLPPLPLLWHKPPHTPQAQQQYAPGGFPYDTAPNLLAEIVNPSKPKVCGSVGFPAVMEFPFEEASFELLVTPELVLFVSADHTIRHIYTDGRSHPKPEDLWPTPVGDSIGHWDGQTLVVDTIARTAGPVFPRPGIANLSEQAHFTERLRRIDADTLEDTMTIEDPLRFTRPWHITVRYTRVKGLDRIIPTGCEHDRDPDVNGQDVASQP